MTPEENRDLFSGFNVCTIIIYSRAGRGYRDRWSHAQFH